MSYEFEYGSSLRFCVCVRRVLAMTSRALAGRLRRAQTFLRTLGIEITFSRESRSGTRMINVSTSGENSVSTVSTVGAAGSNGSRGDQAILAEIRE